MSAGALEGIITALSFSILFFYHLHLIYKFKRAPLTTSTGVTNHLRYKWVKMIRADHPDVLAIQTMRNWIMAASFLASTAVFLSLAMLHAAFGGKSISQSMQLLDLFSFSQGNVWEIKWLVLAIDLFIAFFNFALAIRYFNHASFMITLRDEEEPLASSLEVAKALNRGATHNTLGMRGYYLTIPLVLWLLGPIQLLFGCILLTLIVHWLDRNV